MDWRYSMKECWIFLRFFAHYLHVVRAIIGFLIVLILLASTLIWWVEPISFGHALYFSCITALSVGYGDIVPVTMLGKILSVITGFIGLVTIGLVVAIATLSLRSVVAHLHKDEFGGPDV